MKIVLAIPYNPFEELGGLEISTVRLAASLEKFQQNVRILTKGKSSSVNSVSIEGKRNMKEICEWLVKNYKEFDILNWMEIFPEAGEINVQCLTSDLLRYYGKKVHENIFNYSNLYLRKKTVKYK